MVFQVRKAVPAMWGGYAGSASHPDPGSEIDLRFFSFMGEVRRVEGGTWSWILRAKGR